MTRFVNMISAAGAEYTENLENVLKLCLEELGRNQFNNLLLERTLDRQASLEIDRLGELYLVMETKDSVQRGTFGFCMFDKDAPDEAIDTPLGPFPLYATSKSLSLISEIAWEYFEFGDVPRRCDWILVTEGLGMAKNEVVPKMVLEAGRSLSFNRVGTAPRFGHTAIETAASNRLLPAKIDLDIVNFTSGTFCPFSNGLVAVGSGAIGHS